MGVLHLPLGARKNIALRLAYFEAFPRYGTSQPLLLDIQREVETSGNVLEIASRGAGWKASPLDSSIQQAALDIRSKFDPLIDDAVLRPYFDRLDTALQTIGCENCSSAAQDREPAIECQVCYGNQMLDSVVVANEGTCIRPLHTLFQTALEIATEYYVWAGAPREKLAAVSFSTNQIEGGDWNYDLPGSVHARGGVEIDRNKSRVELNLVPRSFNRSTYESLFYVLLHECVCHVFQGTIDVAGERAVLGNSDAFAEGWMDYVTHLILTQLASGRGPFGDKWSARVGGDTVADAGSYIHSHRTDSARDGLPTRYNRAKTAAQAIRAVFELNLHNRTKAEGMLIQLSVQLNLLRWGDEARENLITDSLLINQLDRYALCKYARDYSDARTEVGALLFANQLRTHSSSIVKNHYSFDN